MRNVHRNREVSLNKNCIRGLVYWHTTLACASPQKLVVAGISEAPANIEILAGVAAGRERGWKGEEKKKRRNVGVEERNLWICLGLSVSGEGIMKI